MHIHKYIHILHKYPDHLFVFVVNVMILFFEKVDGFDGGELFCVSFVVFIIVVMIVYDCSFMNDCSFCCCWACLIEIYYAYYLMRTMRRTLLSWMIVPFVVVGLAFRSCVVINVLVIVVIVEIYYVYHLMRTMMRAYIIWWEQIPCLRCYRWNILRISSD